MLSTFKKLKNNQMKKLSIIAFSFMFISCSSIDTDNIIVTINSNYNYYYTKEKLIAITSSKKDSISFKYKDTLLLKIAKYKVGKLISEANFIYDANNIISDDYIFPEDYYNYYESLKTKIPYKNKYGMLDKDFYYIDAVLGWENFISATELKSTQDLQVQLNKGINDAQYSLFINGNIIKRIKLHIVNNFLKEIDATLIDEPTGQLIKYKKYYQYDRHGRLRFTKTLNDSSGKIEHEQKFEYKSWRSRK
jgi:hypothetical protein